ncbi:MAG TPA: S8 family serine peptidase [Pyrinomonadaceae bacterium]|jgi:serine protease AprX|nr:S8 family serine peptidase [Pyrinomonadaceae bacterium]
MSAGIHDHLHAPNRFAVIPTGVRLKADPRFTGKDVTIAFLDSGFYPHPDLLKPTNRILFYKDLTDERPALNTSDPAESWQWHGTQTSIAAAGNGHLCDGVYRGLANESQLVLVKLSRNGRITEDNIARGIKWVIANRERFNIRVLNISLGGDDDVPCTRSIIDQAAEEAIRSGIIVVAAAGNSSGNRSIPPANSPSVITVGGYHDNNEINGTKLDLYHSSFGPTADGTVKPELVAPAMWVAAPILPGTNIYARAEAVSRLAATPDYQLPSFARELEDSAELPEDVVLSSPDIIRRYVEDVLRELKIVATHYQHVDGTSFAAPIVTSIVAQMLEANPALTPGAIKNILISTADRIAGAPAIRQGFGVVNARRAVALAQNEQHALNSVGCSPPRVQNGDLVFVFHDDEARSVSLAGDFNGWNAASTVLTKDATGLWLCRFATPGPGRYEYKFVVDHRRWTEDPSNGMKVSDGYGGLNSVLIVQ